MRIITAFKDASDKPITGTAHIEKLDGTVFYIALDANGHLSQDLEPADYIVAIASNNALGYVFGPLLMTARADGALVRKGV